MFKNAKKLAAVLGVVTCAFSMSVMPAFAEESSAASSTEATTETTTQDLPQGVESSEDIEYYNQAYMLLYTYEEEQLSGGAGFMLGSYEADMEYVAAYYNCDPEVVENGYDTFEASIGDIGTYDVINNYPALSGAEMNSDGELVITLVVDGDKHDAEFVVYLDPTMNTSGTYDYELVNVAVNVDYTMGEKMQQAGLNTLLGMGTTFVILILLAFLISLFRYIPKIQAYFSKKNKPEEEEEEAPTPEEIAGTAAPAEENLADDGELVAVIAAAIAASEGKTTTDGFVVRSIRKSRKRW